MRKSRLNDEQIIRMLKEHEGGVPTAEICRTHGLSPATFYKFKSKYGGMEVSDARKLKSLEQENARLKRLLADAMLDNVVLKDALGKNSRRQANAERRRFMRWQSLNSLNAERRLCLTSIPRPFAEQERQIARRSEQ